MPSVHKFDKSLVYPYGHCRALDVQSLGLNHNVTLLIVWVDILPVVLVFFFNAHCLQKHFFSMSSKACFLIVFKSTFSHCLQKHIFSLSSKACFLIVFKSIFSHCLQKHIFSLSSKAHFLIVFKSIFSHCDHANCSIFCPIHYHCSLLVHLTCMHCHPSHCDHAHFPSLSMTKNQNVHDIFLKNRAL